MSCPFCQIIKQLSSSPLFVQLFKADPTGPFRLCKHSKMPGVRDYDMPNLDDIPLPPLPPLPPDDGLVQYIPRVAQQQPEAPQGDADEVDCEVNQEPGQMELPAQQSSVSEIEPLPGTSSGYVASAPIDIPMVSGAGERSYDEDRMRYTRAQLRTVLDDTLESGPPYEFEAEVQFPVTYPPGGVRSDNGPKRRSVYPKVRVTPIESDDDDMDEGLPTVVRACYDTETDNVEIGWSSSLSDAMRRIDEAKYDEDDDEDSDEDMADVNDENSYRSSADMMDSDQPGDVALEPKIDENVNENIDENVNNVEQNENENAEQDEDQNLDANVAENVAPNIAQNVTLNGDHQGVENDDDADDQADHQPDDQGRELPEDQDYLQGRYSPTPPSVNGYDPFDMFYSDDGEDADEEQEPR